MTSPIPTHPYDEYRNGLRGRVSGPPPARIVPPFPEGIIPREQWTQPGFDRLPPGKLLNFTELFPSPNPILLELGSGKGRFIISHALAYPGVNHIGVEWTNKYYKFLVDRIGKRGLTNLRVCRDDACRFVMECAPEHSITECHIYHPDPWPKKRHAKRRLLRPAFLSSLNRAMIPNGVLYFQTDHPELWRYTVWAVSFYFDATECSCSLRTIR
jgi:tRNA (guanine-N7-)-methyltransferase